MDKIVGNRDIRDTVFGWLLKSVHSFVAMLCLILVSITPLNAQIKLEAFDADGNPTKQATLGQPFVLEVTADGINNSQIRPEIKGIERFYVRNNGLSMTSINGKTTMKYRYRIRIDTPGNFVIGPANIAFNGTMMSSNSVPLMVSDQPVVNKRNDAAQSSVGGAFLRLTTSKEKVVVGETIKCSLRFYYGNDVTNLSPINLTQLDGFVLSDANQTVRGTETINNKQYNYLDVQWQLCAKEPGKKVIPAYAADFTVRTRSQDFMSHLSMFLGHGGESKRVYSNALNIQVDPLPPHNGPIHGIGNFSQFNARLEPGVAKEGEGMVLALEIEGNGNFNDTILDLNLPKSFKFYDSKNYVIEGSQQGMPKRCFEFIVQGLEKGDWEIPAQKFCFFDVKSRTYKTLETLPITVTILQSQDTGQKFNMPAPTVNNDSTDDMIDASDEIRPLNHMGLWYKVDEMQMPWWLFFVLALMPVGLALYQWRGNFMQSSAQESKRKQKQAFKNARTSIDAALKSNNIKSLYGIFISLFSARFNIDESQISQEVIMERLQQAKLTQEELDQWQQFFNQLSEYVFFARVIKPGELPALVQYARRWLDRFEQAL